MRVSAAIEDWRTIVYCKLENQQIDFKAPQNWNEIGRVGRAKLARHAIALANTMGGYVVIGVGEDASGIPNQYIGLSEEEMASFDPSTVGQTLSTYADPPISLDIVRPEIDGKCYVIIVVYPFSDMPHVCTNVCDGDLQRGAFYIRTPDARSKVAVKASELHLLIQRCLRNQRQMLGRMLRGILYEDRQAETPELEFFPALIDRSRKQTLEKIGKPLLHSLPFAELTCKPTKILSDVNLTAIRNSFAQIEKSSIDELLPEGLSVSSSYDTFATNDSICGQFMVNEQTILFWECFKSGLFCLTAIIPQNNPEERIINAQMLLRNLIVIMDFIGQLYTNIGHPESILDVNVHLANTENARLENLPVVARGQDTICRIPDIEVHKQRSSGDLEGGASLDTAQQLFGEICERFNVTLDKADIAQLCL